MNASPIGKLVLEKPDDARAQILDALRAAGGNATRAARALGVTYLTLTRWVLSLGLTDALASVRAEVGFPDRRRKR